MRSIAGDIDIPSGSSIPSVYDKPKIPNVIFAGCNTQQTKILLAELRMFEEWGMLQTRIDLQMQMINKEMNLDDYLEQLADLSHELLAHQYNTDVLHKVANAPIRHKGEFQL